MQEVCWGEDTHGGHFPSRPGHIGTEQQCVQGRVTLRLPQQHCRWPQLPHRALLRPDPHLRGPQAQQAAPTQLPVPPVLQQRTLHQGLPPGTPQRRGPDSIPGQKALLRRVQVSQVQEKMDERELLGQHGAGVHQVPHQRVPAQAETPREARWPGRVRPEQGAPAAPLREVQGPGLLLPSRAVTSCPLAPRAAPDQPKETLLPCAAPRGCVSPCAWGVLAGLRGWAGGS
uniref:Zinc finger CCHC-type containing 24 n=1 Tax=Theropithecus gelada TaxID=9565 RepID=A0A8D2FCG9_THEGE